MSHTFQGLERRLLRLYYLLWQRRRHNRLVLERIAGFDLVILPQVMNPRLFRSGEFFARVLDEQLIAPEDRVLDMGCGSGIVALAAARLARCVLAVDINPIAVRCTRINIILNDLEDRVAVCESDLFGALQNQRFDVILFNPPYFYGQPRPGFDQAWRSENVVERFVAQLHDHLLPGGSAFLALSSDGETDSFLHTLEKGGYRHETVSTQRVLAETFRLYRFWIHREE